MKQFRSKSIPDKLSSLPKIKSPRDYSTSRPAQSTQLSPRPSQIFRLQKENFELRTRLKEFNLKLSNLIFESKSKIKKNVEFEQISDLDLDFVRKNLVYYENEYNRIFNRQQLLNDPLYETRLKNEVEKLEIKVADYEATLKKTTAKQKIREKALNTVMDTGEIAKLHKIFTELNTELSFYTKRYEKLEKLNAQTTQSYNGVTEKLNELEKDFEVLYVQPVDSKDPNKKRKADHIYKLTRKFEVIAGELDSKTKTMTQKLKRLQEELQTHKKIEEDLQRKIQQSSKDQKKHINALIDLEMGPNIGHRRFLNDDFVNEDFMFVTKSLINSVAE